MVSFPVLPSTAANYGGFGSTYSAVVNPKDAILSVDASKEEVKAGADGIKAYIAILKSIRDDLVRIFRFDFCS